MLLAVMRWWRVIVHGTLKPFIPEKGLWKMSKHLSHMQNLKNRTKKVLKVTFISKKSHCSLLKYWYQPAGGSWSLARTRMHASSCAWENKCVLLGVCVCICTALSLEHKTPPHALFVHSSSALATLPRCPCPRLPASNGRLCVPSREAWHPLQRQRARR